MAEKNTRPFWVLCIILALTIVGISILNLIHLYGKVIALNCIGLVTEGGVIGWALQSYFEGD